MIKKIFSTPLSIVTAPLEQFSGIWNDAGRGSHLIMGLPAIILGVLGVSAILFSTFGDVGALEKRYDGLAQECNDNSKKLYAELNRELRVIASQTGEQVNIHTQIPDTNKKKMEFLESMKSEEIYLEKLIKLDEEDLNYKFRLAELSLLQNERPRGMALMKTIAPQAEPGFAKAHLFLANVFLRKQVKNRYEVQKNEEAALAHLKNCLVRDKTNVEAKQLQAQLLMRKSRYLEAYEIFDDLFQTDPLYYLPMIQINARRGTAEDNDNILDQAIRMFDQKIRDEADDVDAWVTSWQHYVNCLVQKKDFVTAEASISEEIKKQETELANRKFLEKLLARVYTVWATNEGGREGTPEQKAMQLDLLSKSMKYDNQSPETLRWLTFLGTGVNPQISEKARKIYDGRNDPNAPGVVSTELGAFSLQIKDFENAFMYFENARTKAPREPRVLNNLAYAYLKAKNRNPERALLLIDQALTFLPPNARPIILSHFNHTRGEALFQLNRLVDAAASFEAALQERPDNEEILERLMACYQDEKQIEVYRRRLEKVRAGKLGDDSAK